MHRAGYRYSEPRQGVGAQVWISRRRGAWEDSQERLLGTTGTGGLKALRRSLLSGEGHVELPLETSPEQAGSVRDEV